MEAKGGRRGYLRRLPLQPPTGLVAGVNAGLACRGEAHAPPFVVGRHEGWLILPPGLSPRTTPHLLLASDRPTDEDFHLHQA